MVRYRSVNPVLTEMPPTYGADAFGGGYDGYGSEVFYAEDGTPYQMPAEGGGDGEGELAEPGTYAPEDYPPTYEEQ
jgi:hypothetical protein